MKHLTKKQKKEKKKQKSIALQSITLQKNQAWYNKNVQ